MSTTEAIAEFTPAFCNRGSDCQADPASAFCAGCGAGIARYMDALTASREPARIDADEQTPRDTVAAAEADDAAMGDWTDIWRDRLTVAAFGGSALVGAGCALLANLA